MVAEKEIWLDVTITENHAFVSDWTDTMQSHWVNGHKREFEALRREFTAVRGKGLVINIKHNGESYDYCKKLAIWWYTNKLNGNFKRYRLD